MSDNPSVRKRKVLIWVGCVVVVGFAVGIWAAATPAIRPFVEPWMAVFMMLGGLVLLSPLATSRPINEDQRRARRRVQALGAAFVVYGVAQVVPNVRVRLALMGLTLLIMAGAATGFPRRLFARRS